MNNHSENSFCFFYFVYCVGLFISLKRLYTQISTRRVIQKITHSKKRQTTLEEKILTQVCVSCQLAAVNRIFSFLFNHFTNVFLKLNRRSTCPHSYFKIIFQLRKNRCSVLIATADKIQKTKSLPGLMCFKNQDEWYKRCPFS